MRQLFEKIFPWAFTKPEPAITLGVNNKYPFGKLKVGDAFMHRDYRGAYMLARYWTKKLGHRYDLKKVGRGAKVMRVQ